jgi:hypothetical protein
MAYRIFLAACFSAALLLLPFGLEKVNHTFHPGKIAVNIPYNPTWDSDFPSNEISAVLARPFFYLGRGAQAFVFESEDGKFVLKLFRGTPKFHPWKRWLRTTLSGKKERTRLEDKIPPLFNACQMAYTELRDWTGLVYMHLNPTKDLLPTSRLVSCLRRSTRVDLNQSRFVLQKKGKTIADTFQYAIENNDREKGVRLVRSFASLLQERSRKNISNSDKTLWTNFGFVGETAIEWDFGRYYYNPDLQTNGGREKEVAVFRESLQEFLDTHANHWAIQVKDFFP